VCVCLASFSKKNTMYGLVFSQHRGGEEENSEMGKSLTGRAVWQKYLKNDNPVLKSCDDRLGGESLSHSWRYIGRTSAGITRVRAST